QNQTYKIKIINKNKVANSSNQVGDKICIVKIEGINDRNQAEVLRGKELYVLRENFAKTKKNEFYISDLIGIDVVDNSYQKIGKIINVLNNSHNCLIEIEFLDNFISKKNLYKGLQKIDNFPFKNEFFPIVDVEKGFVVLEIDDLEISEISSNDEIKF
ncbi:MAG: 16S rRNA processing protein RimM, partial [Alphaproteobacteria bacterium]|nr:16S rRNA processing protein RimM [Alphaproteobacteria bacterium]